MYPKHCLSKIKELELAAKTCFEKRDWIHVIDRCESILKLQATHVDAYTMCEQARLKFKRGNLNKRILSAGLVVATLTGLVVFRLGWLSKLQNCLISSTQTKSFVHLENKRGANPIG